MHFREGLCQGGIVVVLLGATALVIALSIRGFDSSDDFSDVMLEPIIHDFGQVKDNERASVLLRLTNNTARPKQIAAVGKTCGCTLFDDLSGYIVEPYGSVDLPIEFNFHAKEGSFQAKISVFLRDHERPLTATFLADVFRECPATLSLGRFRSDRVPTRKLRIEVFPGDSPPKMTELEYDPSLVSVTESTEPRAKDATEYVVSPIRGLPEGYFRTPVIVRIGGETARTRIVNVEGTVLGPLAISTEEIVFREADAPGSEVGIVKVYSTYGEWIDIVAISNPNSEGFAYEYLPRRTPDMVELRFFPRQAHRSVSLAPIEKSVVTITATTAGQVQRSFRLEVYVTR